MSDSVANVEIEDVLSSIRRLVSDEVKSRAAAVVDEEEHLLLSQSLRVVSDKAYEDDIASAFEPQDEPRQPDTPTQAEQIDALSALEATIAELEAAVSGTKGFEPEPHQEQDIYSAAPAFFKSSQSEREEYEALKTELLEPVAANLTFVPLAQEEADQPELETDVKKSEPLQLLPDAMVPAEPDQSRDFVDADDEELEDEEILLDEETLRIMVQSIVRTELQGALGEAITRNVRRLIRREIHSYFDGQESL